MNNLKENLANDKDTPTLKPIVNSEKVSKIIADNYYQNFMQNIYVTNTSL